MEKEHVMFDLCADVMFNRPIDLEKDFISPGGYYMKMGEKVVHFDFSDSEYGVDSKNPKILHIEQRNPDYAAFQDLKMITEKMLKNVVEIPEFFVYTGEPGETDLKPVSVISLMFFTLGENSKAIYVDYDVLKNHCVVAN